MLKKVMIELCFLNELPDDISHTLLERPEHFCRTESSLYYYDGQHAVKIDNTPDGEQIFYAMIRKKENYSKEISRSVELYRQILTDTLPGSLHKSLRQNGIISDRKRCVIVFKSFIMQKEDLSSVFMKTVPVEAGDIIVPVLFDTVVLIKNLSYQTMDDIQEYSSAIIDTLEEEGAGCIKAGIGRVCSDVTSLREAYIDAVKAIDLGAIFHGSEKVYVLSQMTLETIIDSIPYEKRDDILKTFYRMSLSGKPSDELLETVRVFFMNDLNLTATAKQLFIHRNTLNYRLDKIQKIYGLDVRSFKDAVVFKLITDFPENSLTEK